MADVTALFPVFIDTDDNGTNPVIQAETDNVRRYLMQVVFQEQVPGPLPVLPAGGWDRFYKVTVS